MQTEKTKNATRAPGFFILFCILSFITVTQYITAMSACISVSNNFGVIVIGICIFLRFFFIMFSISREYFCRYFFYAELVFCAIVAYIMLFISYDLGSIAYSIGSFIPSLVWMFYFMYSQKFKAFCGVEEPADASQPSCDSPAPPPTSTPSAPQLQTNSDAPDVLFEMPLEDITYHSPVSPTSIEAFPPVKCISNPFPLRISVFINILFVVIIIVLCLQCFSLNTSYSDATLQISQYKKEITTLKSEVKSKEKDIKSWKEVVHNLQTQNKKYIDKANFLDTYIVFTTNSGRKYHKYDCSYIAEKDTTHWYLNSAKSSGYSACTVCYG